MTRTTRNERPRSVWIAGAGFIVMAVGAAFCPARTHAATDVTDFVALETTDTGSADSSFAQGAHWAGGEAPTQGKSYYVPAGKTIYLPPSTDNPEFQGDVLAVAGMTYMAKTTVGTADSSITIGDLRLMGGAIMSNNLTRASVSLYGDVTVEATSSSPASILNYWPQGGQRSLNIMGSLKGDANAFLRIARTRRFSTQPYLTMPDYVFRMSGDWSGYFGKLSVGSYGGVSVQSVHPLPGGVEVLASGWWVFDKPSCGELVVGSLDLKANSTVVYHFDEGVSTPASSQYFTVTNTFSHEAAKIQIRGSLLALGCAYTNFPLIRLEGPAATASLNPESFILDISNVDESNLTARLGPYPESPHVVLVAREENGVKTLYLEVGEQVGDDFIKMTVGNGNYKVDECAFYTGHESWWSNNQFPELGPQNDNTYLALKQLTFVANNSFGPEDYDLSGARVIMVPGASLFHQAKTLRLKELHLTANGTSGGYPASYGFVSYSHYGTKYFYGNIVTHRGNSDSHYVYNRAANDYHVYLYGELSGDGNVDFFSTKYSTTFTGGHWYMYNVATNFHAIMRLSASKHAPATEEYVHFHLNDGRALGGTYAGADAWKSIWFLSGFYHITGGVAVTEGTRGLFLDGTTRIEVPSGNRFAVHIPTTFYGVVNKVGAGILTLGGVAKFSNSNKTGNTYAPTQDKNVLNVLDGGLCVDATNAVDGLAITFSAGASLVLPADSADESLMAKGMFNVKWSAPLAFEDAKLNVVFTNAVDGVAPSGRFTRGICTLKTAVVTSLGLTTESFSITPPFRSERIKVLGVTSATDSATDTVTFTAEFGTVGSMFLFR